MHRCVHWRVLMMAGLHVVWRSCVSIRVSELEHRCRVMTDMCPMACLFLWFTHKAKNTPQHARETHWPWVEGWIMQRTMKVRVTALARWCEWIYFVLNKKRMFRGACVSQSHRLSLGECIAAVGADAVCDVFECPNLWLSYFPGKPRAFGIAIFGRPYFLWLDRIPFHPESLLLCRVGFPQISLICLGFLFPFMQKRIKRTHFSCCPLPHSFQA